MADAFTIKVEGLAELDRKLREFGPKIAANGLRAANYAAAKVILDAVKTTAPVRSGTLKAGLVTFRRHTEGPHKQKHSVGVKNVVAKYGNTRLNRRLNRVGKRYRVAGPAFYAKWVEYGHGGKHPAGPHPFMRPAFERSWRAAIDADRERLAKAVRVAISKA